MMKLHAWPFFGGPCGASQGAPVPFAGLPTHTVRLPSWKWGCGFFNLFKRAIMATNITPFFFDETQVRAIAINGEPWIVAADACAALGLDNVTQALSRLDADEQALISNEGIHTGAGNPQFNVINESGLYSLILGSRKPDAKRFKKWVTSEVLPAIRKTGSYTAPGAPVNDGTASALLVAEFTARMLRLQGSSLLGYVGRVNELLAPSLVHALPNYAVNEPAGQQHTGSSEPTFSLTELLKRHGAGVSAMAMNKRLQAAGIIERMSRPSSKGGTTAFWAITEKGLAYGRNLCSPKNEREVAPAFYASRFEALMAQVG